MLRRNRHVSHRPAATKTRQSLLLEHLEDRTVPATISTLANGPLIFVNDDFNQANGTVIVDADPNTNGNQMATIGVDAFATIQAGIDAVASGGKVVITDDLDSDGPGFYSENITINKDVSITASEKDPTAAVIDGGAADSVFTIGSNEVALSFLTVQNGSSLNGGGIFNDGGHLKLGSMVISGNTATGDAADNGGGGIFNNGGTLDIRNSTISDNMAIGVSGSGGGILSTAGSVTITQSTISRNIAVRAGGGIEAIEGSIDLRNVTLGGDTPEDGNIAGGVSAPVVNNPSTLSYDFNETGTTALASGTASDGAGNPLLNFLGNDSRPADLHGGPGSGVSGAANDFAFDNTNSAVVGGSRGQHAADFNAIDALASFTLSGWFKLPDTATESIGRQEALIENGSVSSLDAPGGYRLRGGPTADAGTLELRVNRDFSIESSAVYTEIDEYVYFAVSYDGTSSSNNVKFYKGTTDEGVSLVDTLTLNAGPAMSENVPLTLGATRVLGLVNNTFNGLLDNIRIADSIVPLEQLESNRLRDVGATSAVAANPGNGGGLHVTGAAEVKIVGGMVSGNSAASEGGGLWNSASGTLTVRNVTISNNTASGDDADNGGGGIFNDGGTLDIRQSIIDHNSADGDAGSGGGILSVDGDVAVRNTVISNNEAVRAGGGIEVIAGNVIVRDSELIDNDVASTVGDILTAAPGNGGGLHVTADAEVIVNGGIISGNAAASEGGGLWNSATGSLSVRYATISNNVASGDDADNGGGGIFNDGGSLDIRRTIISSNIADGQSGSGGGILSVSGEVVVRDTTIEKNVAVRAGGGIEVIDGSVTLRNVTLGGETAEDGNVAGVEGVEIAPSTLSYFFNETGTTALASGTASDNAGNPLLNFIGNNGSPADLHAGPGSGVSGEAGDLAFDNTASTGIINASRGQHAGDFDAIDALQQFTLSGWFKLPETATESIGRQDALIENSTISVLDDPAGFRLRGGARADSGTLELRVNRDFSIESSAAYTEIGEYVYFAVSYDGTSSSNNVKFYKGTTDGNVTLVDTLSLNAGVVQDEDIPLSIGVTRTSGLTINPFNGLLDNIRIDDSILSAEQLESNRLSDLGTASGVGANPGNGGGLHVTGDASVTIRDSIVAGNSAASEGGGLWNSANGIMNVREVIISGNTASGDSADNGGGGIFNDGGRLVVRRSTIDDNTADGDLGSGGGILSVDGRVTIEQVAIRNNEAVRAGGGIEVIAGRVDLNEVVLTGNDVSALTGNILTAAPGNGGGLHITADARVIIEGGIESDNDAACDGGGLWNSANGRLNVSNVVISGNTASGNDADNGGGGIFNDGGTLEVKGSTINNNSADGILGSGGGILTVAGEVYITHSDIIGNVANRAGGGIEVINGDVDILFSTLAENVAGPAGSAAPGNGGGLHVTGSDASVTLKRSKVLDNSAASEGGGLWNQAGSTMTVISSKIRNNEALGTAPENGGGGIFNNGGVLDVLFSSITHNDTTGNGGGLFLAAGGDVDILFSDISSNEADGDGGGIFNDGVLDLTFSLVTRNRAGGQGGGIFSDDNGDTDLLFSLVFFNIPDNLA